MNKLINVLKSNRRIVIITALLLLTALITIILIQNTSSEKTNKNVSTTKEATTSFEETHLSGVLSGIDDMTVLVGSTDINYMDNVIYNKDIIKSIDVDDSNVNLMQTGEYQLIYKVTIDNQKLSEHLDKKTNNKQKETNVIVITRKLIVVDLNEAQTLADNDVAVYTDNNGTVAKTNGSPVTLSNESSIDNSSSASGGNSAGTGGNSSSSSSGSGSTSGNGGGNSGSSDDKPAKHEHSWTAITNTVHHEATGHYETQVVQEAYDEPIYESRAICTCGADITGNTVGHYADCEGSYSVKKVQVGTKHHDAVTKQVWVVDKAAWDETVTTGHKCSGCRKIK